MIELRGVSLQYGEKRVFDKFSLSLPDNRITCLYGPSGCGKTTLLHLLSGMLRPQSGSISGLPKNPAVMFQEDRLISHLTALENIAAVLPRSRGEEAKLWLKAVGLEQEAGLRPGKLSGGMRRRVALARALGYGGDFLLLDEPFTGMDRALTAEMAGLIKSTGLPAVVVTHSREEISLLEGDMLTAAGLPFHLIKN